MTSHRLKRVLDGIDALNAQDPNYESIGGQLLPRELAFAQALTAWVLRLNPGASEALRIAARGQHVQRWTIARDTHPMNRAGYLKWREKLKAFHAETVANLMQEAGYAEPDVQRVREIILKRNLKDPDTQTLEDGLCLVFLETQFTELREKTPPEKMLEIVRKTWGKMSAQGRETALTLELGADDRAFLQEALKP